MGKKKQSVMVVGENEKVLVAPVEPIKIEMTFDAWWAMKQGTLKLDTDMKDILKKHFTARGFMKSKEFDKGLKDFGL